MINNIGESTLRAASRIDPSGAIHENEVNQEKTKALAEARIIEESGQGNQTDTRDAKKDETTSRYLVQEKQVVYEKYNKNGDLILRLPPSQTPVNQRA